MHNMYGVEGRGSCGGGGYVDLAYMVLRGGENILINFSSLLKRVFLFLSWRIGMVRKLPFAHSCMCFETCNALYSSCKIWDL